MIAFTRRIVTHMRPDWDAIMSCWLLQRYGGFTDADIVFVRAGETDTTAAAVVDTGRMYHPLTNRYDHHQFNYDESAANLVAQALDLPVWLRPLVALVHAGDIGHADADTSKHLGMHALLAVLRRNDGITDTALVVRGYEILDLLAADLAHQAQGAAEVLAKTLATSPDGRVVLIRNGSKATSDAAAAAGAEIVIFWQDTPVTVTIGMVASRGTGHHMGKIVQRIQQRLRAGTCGLSVSGQRVLLNELAGWFLHETGWYAGRGSHLSPNPQPFAGTPAMLVRFAEMVAETLGQPVMGAEEN